MEVEKLSKSVILLEGITVLEIGGELAGTLEELIKAIELLGAMVVLIGGMGTQVNVPFSLFMQVSFSWQRFGVREHGIRSISQRGPVKLWVHSHEKKPNRLLTQVPLFIQGSDSHSSISTLQFCPV